MRMRKEIRTVTLPDGTVEQVEITHGTDNIFADLGFENAEEMQQKARLRSQVERAASPLGLALPDVIEMAGRRWDEISLGEYQACLDRLASHTPSHTPAQEIAA